MATWGEFQSVIQLSVALNAAYAALAAYIGNDLPYERRLIQEKIDEIAGYSAHGQDAPSADLINIRSNDDRLRALRALRFLHGKSIEIERRYEINLNKIARPVCVISAVLGIIMLGVSSLFATKEISLVWQLAAFILHAPFLAGVIYSVCVSIEIENDIKKPRTDYE